MANITITTDVASLFSHDVYFEFIVQDFSTASYNVDMINLGSLDYENEIPNNTENPTEIGIKAGSLTVDVDNLSSSTVLSEVLESANTFVNRPDDWEAKMYWKLKSAVSYNDPIRFQFSNSDIEYDNVSEIVSFELRPYTNNISTVADYFTAYPADITEYTMSFSIETWDAQIAGEFLEVALEKTFGATAVVKSNVFISTNPSSGTEWFVSKEIQGSTNNTEPVITQIGKMASLEGAMFGACLGTPFYVSRKNTDSSLKVTLDYDNVEKIQKVSFLDAKYENVFMSQETNGVTETASKPSAYSYTDENINISFVVNGLNLANISSATECSQTIIDDSIITVGADNYGLAFGFDIPKEVDITYWGIGDIRSYSTIVLGTDFPLSLRGDYKVKKVTYDWKKDTVKMKLYSQ